MSNENSPSIAENISRDLLVAARTLGLQTHVLRAKAKLRARLVAKEDSK